MKRDTLLSCELCGLEGELSFHHLIPRKTHRKRRVHRRFERAEMQSRGLWLCRRCHRQIHRFFSLDELAMSFNTLEALRSDPRMARYLRWARKQKR